MADNYSNFNIELLKYSEEMSRLVVRIANSANPEIALQHLWDLEDKCEEASMMFDKYKGVV